MKTLTWVCESEAHLVAQLRAICIEAETVELDIEHILRAMNEILEEINHGYRNDGKRARKAL